MEEMVEELQEQRNQLRQDAKRNIQKIQAENKRTYERKRKKAPRYQKGDLVAIQRTQFGSCLKLRPNFLGPYKVIEVKPRDRAVILSDSGAALLAIISDNSPTKQGVLDCRHDLKNMVSLVKTIALQWVHAYCGVPARAQKDYKRVSHKSWRKAILNLGNGPRRRTVAGFHLATGHDCLRNHLYRIKVVLSLICILCSSGEVMDSAHLLHCLTLHKTFLAERYWETRDMLDW
ncbi:uncharacterized protein TNCV_703871 [Trichonephila clavipes]|nr:uncharacterized protein TNCV_703871 [Trichonephila clavipes]